MVRPHLRRLLLAAAIVLPIAPAPASSLSAEGVDFQLASLDGDFVRLSDLPQRVTVLNFWRSDCPPCVRELPMLEAFAASHPEVRVIAVGAQPRTMTEARYPTAHASLTVLVGPGAPEAIMRRFGANSTGIPYTAVLRPNRELCARYVGEITETWLAQETRRCAQ